MPYARNKTTTHINDNVTPKVGTSWVSTHHFEKGSSISRSAIYGGSLVEPSFEQLVVFGTQGKAIMPGGKQGR
eukprot:3093-Prymnesium_polylepis.1